MLDTNGDLLAAMQAAMRGQGSEESAAAADDGLIETTFTDLTPTASAPAEEACDDGAEDALLAAMSAALGEKQESDRADAILAELDGLLGGKRAEDADEAAPTDEELLAQMRGLMGN